MKDTDVLNLVADLREKPDTKLVLKITMIGETEKLIGDYTFDKGENVLSNPIKIKGDGRVVMKGEQRISSEKIIKIEKISAVELLEVINTILKSKQ